MNNEIRNRFFCKFFAFLIVALLSSCIRSLEVFESRENYRKAEIVSATNITDDASSYAHTIGVGINRAEQVGYDMSILFENKSRVDLSANYNFGKANKERKVGKYVVNHTDKRFTEAVSIALDVSYPLIINAKTKQGVIDVTDGRRPNMTSYHSAPGGSRMLMLDSVFYAVHNFRRIRTFNARIGVDHYYSVFGSDFYKKHLYATEPDGIFRFPDGFAGVTINQGTYYLKLGGSLNFYANSNIEATLDGKKFTGRVAREFRFNGSLNYGLLSTISDLNISYTSIEDGQEISRVDHVHPLDYDLSYAAIGGQGSFSWTHYHFKSLVMKNTFFMGIAPGYYHRLSDNFIIGASLRVGIGKIR